jgi:hypothetical protein
MFCSLSDPKECSPHPPTLFDTHFNIIFPSMHTYGVNFEKTMLDIILYDIPQ